MGSVVEFVEISSDEEDFPVARKLPVSPFGWADKLFGEDDEEIGDDFCDLVVMGELSAPPVPLQKKGKSDGVCLDEDEDDCMVLDSDPDKEVTIAEEKGSAGDGSSDELQIVAEKGPVACRDFPHSRHLCSNLPFSTTSHVKHCSMCHCFVCDAPAPCYYWGKGVSTNDHCHATDKETKWKTLRQAFKCRSLPASHPEKHQNAVYPNPAMTSPRQQDIQCQVSVPQSHPSFISKTGGSSLAKRNPLLNAVSQNQQRHTSVRVSLNVGQTVSAPRAPPVTRAGRGMGNAHSPQITHSRPRFKRVGSASPGLTVPNSNQSLMHQTLPHVSQPVQAAPRTNAFTGTIQKNAPQRSLSAPIESQGQQGQPVPSCQVASSGMHGIGPQLSRCTSLMTQRSMFLPEPAMDVCTKSWQDILASVASDLGVSVPSDQAHLGVSDYSISTSQSQQPVSTSSQSLQSSANQGVDLHPESVAATTNLMTSNVHDLSNHATAGNVLQANGPTQTTQGLHYLNDQSNLIPDEAHVNSFPSSPADRFLIEAAHPSEFDSTDLIFDFELEGWG